MPDRSIAPPIASIGHIDFPQHETYKMCGSIPTTVVSSDHQEVIKIELIFGSGRIKESKKLVAKYTNMLLKSGTTSKTSTEINQYTDYYGATISQPVSFDHAGVTLYCLTRFAHLLIPLLVDLVVDPTFPEAQLEIFRAQQKSKLEVALSKVDIVAYRQITEKIFGVDHPYGYNSKAEDHDAITTGDIKAHHSKTYHANNCRVFISGNFTPDLKALLESNLSRLPSGSTEQPDISLIRTETPHSLSIEMPDKVQCAIRIGRGMFAMNHPDYINVYLMHVLLGGYFGSRLSRVIREEKGYTYGIHTVLDSMLYGGCFMISTEVDKDYVEDTIAAIHHELDDIRNHPMPEDEILQMTSYLKGYLISSVNGVFKTAGVIKTLTMAGGDIMHFERLQHGLDRLSAKDIQQMAEKYLKKEDLWQIVVGQTTT